MALRNSLILQMKRPCLAILKRILPSGLATNIFYGDKDVY
ncbi:hypothetical protein BTN49_0326 (plasmid) [Candidatus Enterovibrio escicola]|uniref:Uncharacterized protein n=1 Tax=Candidatus Enterovibrio escicola TaxID=1927127 RepID=A0A2A5T780_9GAMM|nr:hypothetical protein BTN49_0326 [Candidatus Enterovibrio escacola]